MDGRDGRVSQCRRHLHWVYHARLSRQVHAVHESTPGFSFVFGCRANLWACHSRLAAFHPGIAEQGTQLAKADAEMREEWFLFRCRTTRTLRPKMIMPGLANRN